MRFASIRACTLKTSDRPSGVNSLIRKAAEEMVK